MIRRVFVIDLGEEVQNEEYIYLIKYKDDIGRVHIAYIKDNESFHFIAERFDVLEFERI